MDASDDPMAEGIAALSHFFVGDGTLGDTLTTITTLARDVIGADMAGITMLVEGRPRTGIFTDPEAPEIDSEQYESGGPCLDSFRNQHINRIEDLGTDRRWPEFVRRAVAHGVRSTLSLPLSVTGEPLGALNLYFRSSGALDERSVTAASSLAGQAAVVLANARAYHDARELSENLHVAMASRATIDRAVGVLMAEGGRSPEEAFQLMVRASQRTNRKVRDIAGEVLEAAMARGRNAPAGGPAEAGAPPATDDDDPTGAPANRTSGTARGPGSEPRA